MKIVFLAPFGLRPKGTVIARMVPLAAELQSLGHQVVIIAPPYTNPEDSGVDEIINDVRVRNIELTRLPEPLRAGRYAWRIYKLCLEESPELVHLFKPKGYGGLSAFIHLLRKVFSEDLPPLFVDTDDWEGKGGMETLHDYSFAEKWLFRFQEKWLPRCAVGVTVASRALHAQICAFGVSEERILYLPNCVTSRKEVNLVNVRHKYSIPIDAPIVLLYTRFFEFTQSRLHKVFEGIHRQRGDAHFLVVGHGRHNEEVALEVFAEEHGFRGCLHVAGWVEPEQLPDYFSAGDVAIYPLDNTLVNRSKCPAKLTELMSAGVPVVADAIGQATEYIQDGRTGCLSSPEEAEDMVLKVVKLLHDKDVAGLIGSAAMRSMQTEFTWKSMAEDLDRFYNCCSRG